MGVSILVRVGLLSYFYNTKNSIVCGLFRIMSEHEICTTLLCVLCRRTKSAVFQSISFSMLILLFSVLFHFISFYFAPNHTSAAISFSAFLSTFRRQLKICLTVLTVMQIAIET